MYVLEVRYIILWMFLVSALRQICISPMLSTWISHFNAKVIRSNLKHSCYCFQIKILDFLNALWLVQSVSLFCMFCTLPWLYIENPRLASQVSKRCNPMPPIFMVMISLESCWAPQAHYVLFLLRKYWKYYKCYFVFFSTRNIPHEELKQQMNQATFRTKCIQPYT